ncbi:hypothetical protein SAMN05421743_101217 [Thalassobacillus cyri]|uniref:Uncharacterized protein n=1 Tax=Thalassobacillus cyri TaxID=571932 RepID=A0A1H3VWN6_9BACI|nr:hypothetical protein [Thalassobacillus cyri]SDZ79199.1 hypothetical protein SAMN05421743_101217 [Thalassobacillus cyri]
MKIRNLFIGIIFCILVAPFVVNLLLSFSTPITFGSNWESFFGSYIGSIIGGLTAFFIAYYQIEKQKNSANNKELKENRSYIIVEEFTAPVDLSNTKHKEFSKLVLNEYYEEFKSNYSKAELKSISIPYYKINHRGIPEIILDCSVECELSEDEGYKQTYKIEAHIGIFEKDIDVFIPIVKGKAEKVYVKSVKVNYSTIKGEKMQYFLDIDKKEEKHITFLENNKKETIFNFKINSSNWILPNSKL